MTEAPEVAVAELFQKAKLKSDKFSDLISKIEDAPDETKALWREIYENAISDRMNAYLLFVDLYKDVANKAPGHLNFGTLMTKYIERMNKGNDQLLKLAEQIEKARTASAIIDADALYDEISETSG